MSIKIVEQSDHDYHRRGRDGGRLISVTQPGGDTVSYTYDGHGNRLSMTYPNGKTAEYVYDGMDRLISVKGVDGVTTTYEYDALGRRTKTAGGKETTEYTYDEVGDLIGQTATGTTRYTYNALNLLQSYTGEDGYTETYTYNADRLLSSVTTPETTTNLTWDILYGDGVVISETTGKATTDYTYGLERISALTGSNRAEYIYDARGSVAAEVSYNNAWYTFGGTLGWKNISSKSYIPFGEQIGEKTSGFGYNGEYYNAATGMVYLRARFYEPEMNRFSQKDILRCDAANPVSLNRYAYVQNDPVNFIDPSGMSVRSLLQKGKAAVTGAVKSFVANPIRATVSTVKKVVNAIKTLLTMRDIRLNLRNQVREKESLPVRCNH